MGFETAAVAERYLDLRPDYHPRQVFDKSAVHEDDKLELVTRDSDGREKVERVRVVVTNLRIGNDMRHPNYVRGTRPDTDQYRTSSDHLVVFFIDGERKGKYLDGRW